MEIVIIAAVAENGVIGRAGGLPWGIPEDMKRFRELTLGHAVIMGRKTFESIGKPLDGRANIVITSQKDYAQKGIVIARSVEEAFEKSENEDTLFVMGGQGVFEAALPFADRLELTLVRRAAEGDAYFPSISGEWKEVRRDEREGFSFVTYIRN